MNILIAVSNLQYKNGGVSTHVVDLCREYSRLGHKVVLIADGLDYKDQIECLSNVNYYDFPFESNAKSLKIFVQCLKSMINLCNEYSIDVIHVHGQRIIPYAQYIKRKMGIPYVWSNHTDAIPHEKLLLLMHKVWKFPIISVSQDMADHIINNGFSPKYITVINNPIDIKSFSPLSNEEYDSFKKEFEISDNQYVVCILSRINENKGQGRLIRALHEVELKHPEQSFKLLISGAGDMDYLEREVMSYARENGVDCKYCGFADQRGIFGVSDLFVLPSLYEGFALVCVEAVCAGCATVRSETPGWKTMKDFVLHFEKNNIQAMADTILFAYEHQDLMKEKVRIGQDIINNEFEYAKQCSKILDVYTREINAKQ